MEKQHAKNSQNNLKQQKRSAGGITIPDVMLYYRAIIKKKQHGTHIKKQIH